MASNYPTGPQVTTTPLITGPAHPSLLLFYGFWVFTATSLGAFAVHRAARSSAFQRKKEQSSAPTPKISGGFGALKPNRLGAKETSTDGTAGKAVGSSGSNTPTSAGSGASVHDIRLDVPDDDSVRRVYYRDDSLGSFAFGLYSTFLVHLYVIFLLLLVDNYWGCQFRHIDNMCFRGSHPFFGSYAINSYIFFIVWHLVLLFYGFSLRNKEKLRNWFRIPCKPEDAQHVWIWTRVEEEVRVDERQVSPIVKAIKKIKAKFITEEVAHHEETVSIFTSDAGSRCYEFQGSRYVLAGGEFKRSTVELGASLADLHKGLVGLPDADARKRIDVLGRNEIPFRVDSMGTLMRKEFFTYFYIYQLLMYMIWFWHSYLVTGSLVFAVVILSGMIKVLMVRRSQLSLKKLTDYVTAVIVLRDGEWTSVRSTNLVPGDLMRVHGEWVMPCDAVILSGAAVCNESTLTGEPMPLQKVQAPPESDRIYSAKGRGARYTLFAGTTVLQADHPPGGHVLAIVTGTGMSTSKGEIMSAILYPSRLTFKYTAELPVVIFVILCYAVLNFSLSLYLVLNNGSSSSSWVTYWCTAIFTVSQVLSPLLPVALVAGQIKATSRLQKLGVFCLNPAHIPICGKLRVFCFDKTGTLTREGLDFLGFRPLSAASAGKLSENKASYGMIGEAKGRVGAWGTLGTRALASCHSVSTYNGEYVGNQLEVAMFAATGWKLSEAEHQRAKIVSPDGKDSVTTIRRFEFDHGRQTMSTVVRFGDGSAHAFLKGSFERVGQLADPDSLPSDYLESARALALDGCYVLAVSHRELGDATISDEELAHMSRDEAEQGGRVLGLLAFRNELKHDSAVAISELRQGDVRPVMITGDNAMCGLYIARQAGMISPKAEVLLAERPPAPMDKPAIDDTAKSGNKVISQHEPIVWRPLRGGINKGKDGRDGYKTAELLDGPLAERLRRGEVELAVSGAAYDELEASGAIERLLLHTRIFARVSPERKVDVVRLHQAMGLVVGMCGDGGNDCGALRVAHAGIALSDAEASVVSSFTSRSKSCTSVVDLVKEGRAALHTNFAAYKFIITYGQLFSLMKVVMFYGAVVPSRLFYFATDVVAVLLMTWAMNFSAPQPQLASERPTSSLLGANTLASILGLHAINTATFVAVVITVFSHPDYVPWPRQYVLWKDNWLHADNWEATAISFPMYMLFISSGVIFSFGYKFRQPVYTNIPLMLSWLGLMCMQAFLLLSEPNTITDLWHVASRAYNAPGTTITTWQRYQAAGGAPSPGMPFDLRLRMFVMTLIGVVFGAIWQSLVVDGPLRRSFARRFPGHRPRLLL